MKFIKELGCGFTRKALLYEENGEKITILRPRRKEDTRKMLQVARREANITRRLTQLSCDIRTVQVRRRQGEWEVAAHYVKGEPLEPQRFAVLAAEQQEKLLADLAEFLLSLHCLDASMSDELYADETDEHGWRFTLASFFYKLFCFKKDFQQYVKPPKNPLSSRKFRKAKADICKRFHFTKSQLAQIEQVINVITPPGITFAFRRAICSLS